MTKQLIPLRLFLSAIALATGYYYAYTEVEIQVDHCWECSYSFDGVHNGYDCARGLLDLGMHFLAALIGAALTASICIWLYKQLRKLYDYGVSKGLKTFDFRFLCFTIVLSSLALSKKAEYDRFDSLTTIEKFGFARDGISGKESRRIAINKWIENKMNLTIDNAHSDQLMVLVRLSKRNDSFSLDERCGIWEPRMVKDYLSASKKFEEASIAYEEADDSQKVTSWIDGNLMMGGIEKEHRKSLLQSSLDDLNSSISALKMLGYFGADTCGGCDCKE